MNCFDSLSGNSCLWILILMLVIGNCNKNVEGIFTNCSMPIILGLLFFLWKDGKFPSIGGCGCND